jgi:hypothetical protein
VLSPHEKLLGYHPKHFLEIILVPTIKVESEGEMMNGSSTSNDAPKETPADPRTCNSESNTLMTDVLHWLSRLISIVVRRFLIVLADLYFLRRLIPGKSSNKLLGKLKSLIEVFLGEISHSRL